MQGLNEDILVNTLREQFLVLMKFLYQCFSTNRLPTHFVHLLTWGAFNHICGVCRHLLQQHLDQF